jgi:rRNA maturation endonuclease Nob1
LPESAREALEREKRLVLRSIKELEFDKAMGKVSEADFAAIMSPLRARALTLMRDLERAPATEAAAPSAPSARAAASAQTCPSCGTANDADARFCKSCGSKVGA